MSILLQSFDINLDIDNYNNDFLILKSANTLTLRTLGKAIFQAQFDFVEEVIVTEVEICLKLNNRFDETKMEWFKTLGQKEMQPPKTYPLPVYFSEHEDWATVETLTGLKKNEIIVGEAIIHVLNNWHLLFLEDTPDGKYQKKATNNFAKNKILLFLKEQTKLTTKEIRMSMKPFKEIYNLEKSNFYNED
jgi:hypothetical protein